jgi:hypothetical protein
MNENHWGRVYGITIEGGFDGGGGGIGGGGGVATMSFVSHFGLGAVMGHDSQITPEHMQGLLPRHANSPKFSYQKTRVPSLAVLTAPIQEPHGLSDVQYAPQSTH